LPTALIDTESGWQGSVWSWVRSCSRLLLRVGTVALAILTIWVLVGSLWFPDWWYIAVWEGEIINIHYLGYGFSYLLDDQLSTLFWIAATAGIIAVYLYIKRTQFREAVGRFGGHAIIVCIALLPLDALYLRQPKFREQALLTESISQISTKFLKFLEPQEPPQIRPPIDFFYIDDARVNDIFGELEPDLIETQRTISSTKKLGGSAGVEIGRAALKGEIAKEGQEESKYERGESSAKRRCIEIMNLVLKNGSGHYYKTAREFYEQQMWAKAKEEGREGYQKASEGYNPKLYAKVRPIEDPLSAADAIDNAGVARANVEIAKLQLASPTPEQRMVAMKQIASWNQGFREEARGFIIVDGTFHITRSNDSVVFEEEFSPRPDKIVFRFTLPARFDSGVFHEGFRMRVFGDVIQGGDNSSILAIHPLAVFND